MVMHCANDKIQAMIPQPELPHSTVTPCTKILLATDSISGQNTIELKESSPSDAVSTHRNINLISSLHFVFLQTRVYKIFWKRNGKRLLLVTYFVVK